MSSIVHAHQPVGLASDHAGYEAKQIVIRYLQEKGIPFKDFGAYDTTSSDYADFAHPMADAVEKGECYPGIAICGTGNGINMTMNKHQGIRSALCWNSEITRLTRTHNDANVLTLPGRYLSKEEIVDMLDIFLSTPFEGGRHEDRIKKIPCSR